jgi:hypothetical protein
MLSQIVLERLFQHLHSPETASILQSGEMQVLLRQTVEDSLPELLRRLAPPTVSTSDTSSLSSQDISPDLKSSRQDRPDQAVQIPLEAEDSAYRMGSNEIFPSLPDLEFDVNQFQHSTIENPWTLDPEPFDGFATNLNQPLQFDVPALQVPLISSSNIAEQFHPYSPTYRGLRSLSLEPLQKSTAAPSSSSSRPVSKTPHTHPFTSMNGAVPTIDSMSPPRQQLQNHPHPPQEVVKLKRSRDSGYESILTQEGSNSAGPSNLDNSSEDLSYLDKNIYETFDEEWGDYESAY